MGMQFCRTKFRKSCILLAKNCKKCFRGKNPVKSTLRIWTDHFRTHLRWLGARDDSTRHMGAHRLYGKRKGEQQSGLAAALAATAPSKAL